MGWRKLSTSPKVRPDGKASLCFELLGRSRPPTQVAVGGFLANKAWFAEQIEKRCCLSNHLLWILPPKSHQNGIQWDIIVFFSWGYQGRSLPAMRIYLYQGTIMGEIVRYSGMQSTLWYEFVRNAIVNPITMINNQILGYKKNAKICGLLVTSFDPDCNHIPSLVN